MSPSDSNALKQCWADPGLEEPASVYIMLPVLNEIANIEPLLTRIDRTLSSIRYVVGILDDGSTDGTLEYLQQCATEPGSRVRLMTGTKTGLGSRRGRALRTLLLWGLTNTDAKVFVEMDGDLSHQPEELLSGLALLQDGKWDIAIGSKYLPGSAAVNRGAVRDFVSQVARFACSVLFRSNITDYSNGYRFYTRRVAEITAAHKAQYATPSYLFEVLALWLQERFRIVEFPSVYIGRLGGSSKLGFADFSRTGLDLLEIAFRYHVKGFTPTPPKPEPPRSGPTGSCL